MKAIVLANGSLHDPEVVRARLAAWEGALVVAANGGSRYAALLGLRLDVVIGDLDSVDAEQRSAWQQAGVQVRSAPPEKDETDLELALLYVMRQGAQHVAVIAALGSRLDMTLANVLLLTHPALRRAHVEMWNGDQTAWLIRPPDGAVNGAPGDTLSLIPLGGPARGVATLGLKYPLRGETLAFGPARGVSNVLTVSTVRVELREGLLLAVHTPGRA